MAKEEIIFNSKISLGLATKLKDFFLSKKILIDFQGPNEVNDICRTNTLDFTKKYVSIKLSGKRFGVIVIPSVKEATFLDPVLKIVINNSGLAFELKLKCKFNTHKDNRERITEIIYTAFFVF